MDINTCSKPCNNGCISCNVGGFCEGASCKTGYEMQIGGVCKLLCAEKCVTCEISDNTVCTGTTCNGNNRDASNNCICESNYIEITGTCQSKIYKKKNQFLW